MPQTSLQSATPYDHRSPTQFLNFPTEILDVICRFVPSADQLSLCLVCQRLKGISTRLVYHTISSLSMKSSRVVKLFRTLARVPEAAAAVKKLSVSVAYRTFGGFNRIFRDALMATTSLISLVIFDSHEAGLSLHLKDCYFPRLKEFEVASSPSVSQTDALYRFLSRHPTIQQLVITPDTMDVVVNVPYKPLALPKLQEYHGTDAWLDVIITLSEAELISIDRWDYLPSSPRESFDHVARLLTPSKGAAIRDFTAHLSGWDARALSMLQNLSELEYLSLINQSDFSVPFSPGFLEVLEKQTLPRMPHLREINFTNFWSYDEDEVERVDELENVLRWHKPCLQLNYITFPSERTWWYTEWNNSDSPIWIPLIKDDRNGGLVWTLLAIATGRYPVDWDSLPEGIQKIILAVQAAFPHQTERPNVDTLYSELQVSFNLTWPEMLPEL
ncbi:hypothetical protein HGRIS_004194 [Hohenbuehelia grisea]|uniref:F-box domain-containing protein n=1 Tax=Hohenbuehelia grisea TaxID=104357 RepID=A0ABR3JHR9_9AGAR